MEKVADLLQTELESLISRLRKDELGQSEDPVQRNLDRELLQYLERACQQTLTGDSGFLWTLAQWGEQGADGLGHPQIESPRWPYSVEQFTNVRIGGNDQRGCVASSGWVLPVEPDLTVEIDASQPGVVKLSTTLHCDKDDLERMCPDQASLSIYFDPANDISGAAFEAWRNLKTAFWFIKNDSITVATELAVQDGLPMTVDEPEIWSRLMKSGFPFSARIIHIPLKPLLEGGDDNCLTIHVDLGVSQSAKLVANHLSERLKLNVMPLVNAWRCLDDTYRIGNPLQARQPGASSVGAVTILSANCAGVPARERRWMLNADQADLSFDVQVTDGNWFIWPSSGLPDQEARWRVQYLLNLNWSKEPEIGSQGEIDHDGRGLGFRLITAPVPVRLGLLERLTQYAIPASRAEVNTPEDLWRVCDQRMPPLLRESCTLTIRTCFGPDPAHPESRHAVPLIALICMVKYPEDRTLISQARWLRQEIVRLGLPLGTILDVRLEAVGHD